MMKGSSEESKRGETAGRLNTPQSSVIHFLSTLISDAWLAFRRWPWPKKILIICVFCALLIFSLTADLPSIATLRGIADSSGAAFPWVFCALYIFITLFPIPRTVLTLAAGILFGPVLGSVLALVATTMSAVISLLIVRLLLGDWMRPRLTHPAVAKINIRLHHRGWLAITSLRMIAAVPFSLLNYVVALTSVPVFGFALATLIGSAPGTIATVVLGDAFVGHGNWMAILITTVLAALGILGIVLDQKLPVKSIR